MFARVKKLPHVTDVISPYAGASAGKAISGSGKIAFATVVFDEKAGTLPKSAPERVVKAAAAASQPGLEVALGGQAIEQTEQAGFGLSTAVGLIAAIVVLLLTFGSLIAMGLPIVTALFGLGTGLGAIALFTHIVDTPNFSSELAAMIGLGRRDRLRAVHPHPLQGGVLDARARRSGTRASRSSRRWTPPGAPSCSPAPPS